MLYLHKLTEVFSEYFKELEEESIRDNFVIVYELLDEMMDFGYPQTTETKILQESVCLNEIFYLFQSLTVSYSVDTLLKMHTSWKYKCVHLWL